MKVSDFDYGLPPERIAQEPAEPRDAARLLVHDVARDVTRHGFVRDLVQELRPGDLLVVNDTRVRPARLRARRASGAEVELLLLEPAGAGGWRALVRPAKKPRPGEELALSGGLRARMLAREGTSAFWRLALEDPEDRTASVEELLERAGELPLPPYIRRAPDDPRSARDEERYQTVYAAVPGAVAAPTAGLHFTRALLAALAERGVERAAVTLHVGLGTFQPVSADDTDEHAMHAERYVLSPETVAAVRRCRSRGGRVVAVGTTSVRVLEASAAEGPLAAGRGATRLFITPGYRFRVVDALLTNFHLPRSTLLMLVSAFAGRERTLGLYREAVGRGYRFYSYGDAMLLVR
jgi:S-adenosylmethionine:tRNA ribosyltransferase-isomerase